MALLRRLLILGAAGAGAAYFLKQRQSDGEPALGDGGGATTTDIGDEAAAGTGPSETLQEQGKADEAEPPAEETPPAEDAGAGETTAGAVAPTPDATLAQEIPSPSQPTQVGNPVMPDTSADPMVRDQENAAAAEAGSIGGTPDTPQSQEGLAEDPAMKPVVEAAGEEPETLESSDRERGGNRELPGASRDLGAE